MSAITTAASQVGRHVVGATRTALGSGSPIRGSFWAPGLTLAAVAGGAAMGPSLFPKDPKLQTAVVGVSSLLGFGAGAVVEGIGRTAGRFGPSARMGTLGALAGAGLLTAAGVSLSHADERSNAAAAVGTTGLVAGTGAATALVTTSLARHVPNHGRLAQLAAPIVAGGAVLARALHDNATRSTPYLLPDVDLPHVDPNEPLALRKLTRLTPTEAMPGVDPSTVQLDKLPPNGLRFVLEGTSMEEIRRTMGEEPLAEPRRVYVGLDEAPADLTEPELIEWMSDRAMDRLEATGSFERSRILVVPTTSTGFVDPQAPLSAEMMSRGDIATVAMQAGHKKAAFELGNLDRATAMHERLLEKITARIASMPESERPIIDVYGESYGAWTGQNAYIGHGVGGLDEHGVDQAMYVGSPRGSQWRNEVLGADGVQSIRSAASAQDLSAADARGTRVTFLTHDADPVSNFAVDNLWKRPDWLPTDGERGENIPPQQRWWPAVTGLQLAVDQQLAQTFTPGVLEAKGHDYRSEVGFVMRRAFGFDDVSDTQVARIREYGRQSEVRWTAAKADLLPPTG